MEAYMHCNLRLNKLKRYTYYQLIQFFIIISLILSSSISLNATDIEEEKDIEMVVLHPPQLGQQVTHTLTENERGEVNTYIKKYIIEKEEISESSQKKILRYLAKGGITLFAASSGIPYFDIGYQAGGNNVVIKYMSATLGSIVTSSGGLYFSLALTDHFQPVSDEERVIIKKNKLPLKLQIPAHIIGLLGSVPTGYATYKFNTIKWFFVMGAAFDYTLITTGFLDLFKAVNLGISKTKRLSPEQIEENQYMEELNKNFIDPLENKFLKKFLTLPIDQQSIIYSDMYEGEDILHRTPEKYLTKIMQIGATENSELINPYDTRCARYSKNIFVGGLALLPLLNTINNGYLGYKGWMLLTDNTPFSASIASFTALCLFALETRMINESANDLADKFFYKIKGIANPDLLGTIAPKYKTLAILGSIGLGAIAGNLNRFVVANTLTDLFPDELAYACSAIGFSVYTIIASNVNYQLLQDLYINCTKYCGSVATKKVITIFEDIQKLKNIIVSSTYGKIKQFFSNMSFMRAN
jgi:hypothetical protein